MLQKLTGCRVLVVDDEAMIRFMVTDEFEHQGCSVETAADGAEALAVLIDDGEFDLMVTDIRMPRLDGWTLAERAREVRPQLPVVYVTGFTDVLARPVPGAEVLGKPFRPADLVAAAERLIAT